MLRNTQYSYGSVSKIFHWIIAVLIMSMLAAGFTMFNLKASPLKWQLYSIHKATGVVILMLVALRLIWRLSNIRVESSSDLSIVVRHLANISHNLLYVMIFLMPVSGILMSLTGGRNIDIFGLYTIKSLTDNIELSSYLVLIHQYSAIILSCLIVIHICAALYHHYIRRDNVLIQMI